MLPISQPMPLRAPVAASCGRAISETEGGRSPVTRGEQAPAPSRQAATMSEDCHRALSWRCRVRWSGPGERGSFRSEHLPAALWHTKSTQSKLPARRTSKRSRLCERQPAASITSIGPGDFRGEQLPTLRRQTCSMQGVTPQAFTPATLCDRPRIARDSASASPCLRRGPHFSCRKSTALPPKALGEGGTETPTRTSLGLDAAQGRGMPTSPFRRRPPKSSFAVLMPADWRPKAHLASVGVMRASDGPRAAFG